MVLTGSTLVAPYDLHFADDLKEAASAHELFVIPHAEFERKWGDYAQPRLHFLADSHRARSGDSAAWYVRSPFPAEFKVHEGESSVIYTEFVGRVARRHFEVFSDKALVAPYDVGWPEHVEMIERAVDLGVDDLGIIIDRRLRPVRISQWEFESQWEEWALPRLQEIALGRTV